jgi:hypothetical protein
MLTQTCTVPAGSQMSYAPVARYAFADVISERVQKFMGRVLNDGLAKLAKTSVCPKIASDREDRLRLVE